MSSSLIIPRLAEEDLLSAQEWYSEQRPGLGDEFRLTIDRLIRRIAENPRQYPEVYRGVRRAVVRRFPYLLYYVLRGDVVVVLACLHSKLGPARLRSRVP